MAAERKISTRIELKGDKEFKKKMRGVAQEVKSFGGWADVMKGILGAAALKTGLKALGDGIQAAIDASVEFESAIAGVAKTTDMSAVELDAMGESIKDLATEIPLSTTELAKLVETGGQLGVPNENLLEFTETMAALGVATNLSGDQAATALSRLANIMGTSQDDYDRMGSSIVALGNNMATTESEIVDMSERLAAAGKTVGLTEADVFALAATLSSLGIEAEAGGSAMSKLMKEIETMVATSDPKLEKFAETAGMSADQFAKAWKEDPLTALDAFVTGLGKMDESGGNSIVMLEKLGITEVRQSAAVLALAKSHGLLTEAANLSNTAWKENTALAKEAETRYATTESKITLFKNSVNNMAIAVGDKLSPMLNGLMDGATDAVQWLTTVIAGEQDLRSMIADADTAYADTEEQMAAAAAQADVLIDRLEELEGKPTLTAAEQREWNATLEKLQEIMPSTTALINENTGAIDGGTAALRLNTEETKRNALEVAKQTALQAKYEAYYQIAGKIADKQVELTLALADESSAQARLNALIERQGELFAKATAESEKLGKEGTYISADELLQTNEEYQALTASIQEASAAQVEASEKTASLNSEIANGNAQMEEAAAVVSEYEAALSSGDDAILGMKESEEQLSEAAQEQVDQFGAASAALDTLIEKQRTAYAESLKQIETVISGFDKVEMPKPKKIKDTTKDLQSQLDFIDKYTKNLQKAQELGLSDELTKQLSDGSTESAAILQGIVNDGGKNIDKLNAKFAEVSTGKEAMATAMAEAQTDFTTKSDAIVAATNAMVDNFNQEGAAKTAAAATIQGVIDGMNSKLTTLQMLSAKIKRLANPTGSSSNSDDSFQPNDNTHAAGLAYVPYDNYGALLHRGEMVLTALEAKAYRAETFANYGSPAARDSGEVQSKAGRTINNYSTVSLDGANIYVNDKQDIRAVAYEVVGLQSGAIRALGGTP